MKFRREIWRKLPQVVSLRTPLLSPLKSSLYIFFIIIYLKFSSLLSAILCLTPHISQNRRYLTNNALEQLKFIPEFETGLRQQSQTDWRNSLVNFHRVREILVNSMGEKSELTAATDLRF